jgi:chromosome partitioning protein
VIDTPPGEGEKNESPITDSAVLAADAVLLPSSPTSMDIDRLAPTLDLLRRVELRHKHTVQLHVLFTRVRAGTTSSVAHRLVLESHYKLPVLKPEIPLLEHYANAMWQPVKTLGKYLEVTAAVGERAA